MKLYKYEEYDNINDQPDFIFFNRTKYEIHAKLLFPKFDEL